MEKPGFGNKLIEIRKAKGLTQEEVAEKCHVTVRTIQRIESGMVQPRAYTIKIICEALEFDFFDASAHAVEGKLENRLPEPEKQAVLWQLKDLLNLKTNTMKKISLLSATFVLIGLSVFFLISKSHAQAEKTQNPGSLVVQFNSDKSVRKIEARFSNDLTFDSLVNIRSRLKTHGITIHYKQLKFDEQNRLAEINCDVDTNDGMKGSFGGPVSSADSKTRFGFFRDYTKGAKIPFCTGSCDM